MRERAFRKRDMTVFEELKARGILAQTSGEREVQELVDGGKAVFYIGFDPTADSLTVGHFCTLVLMRLLQRAGNKPIVLIGGGTTMVGDPTDKTDMRSMMTVDTIDRNAECFKRQMQRFIDFPPAIMVNNADWLRKLNYIEFLREVGVHFSVNQMLTADCYRTRLEKGLSFLEFNYMLMQGYDFYHLHQTEGANLQCGGDDQWSNILGGRELIRRKLGHEAHVLTIRLLETTDGSKMGKTAKGAVWLDPEKTTPFEFYQYFRNRPDGDVLPFLNRLTFVPLGEIAEYAKLEGQALNPVKERLAFELTALVHGEGEAEKAQETARSLFSQAGQSETMPTTTFIEGDLSEEVPLLDLMVKCGLASSKGEARRLVEQGGVEVGGRKASSPLETVTAASLRGDGLVIKKGKKVFHRARLI